MPPTGAPAPGGLIAGVHVMPPPGPRLRSDRYRSPSDLGGVESADGHATAARWPLSPAGFPGVIDNGSSAWCSASRCAALRSISYSVTPRPSDLMLN